MLMAAHALADAWGGMTPYDILDRMTPRQVFEAMSWYQIKHREQTKARNQQAATQRAAKPKRLF